MFVCSELPPLPTPYYESSSVSPDADWSRAFAASAQPARAPNRAQPAEREGPNESNPSLKRLPTRFIYPEPIFPPLRFMLADTSFTFVLPRV